MAGRHGLNDRAPLVGAAAGIAADMLLRPNARPKTEAGKALAEKTAVRILNIENDIFACWSDEEVKEYLRLTEQFLNGFRKRAAQL